MKINEYPDRQYEEINAGKRERNVIRAFSDPLVAKAIGAAHRGFEGVVRKLPKGYPPDKTPDPYVSHVMEVGYMLACYLYPPEVVAAGILHDHVEDLKSWNVRRISREFTPEIAALVQVVTQPHRGEWQERKDAYFRQVELGPPSWPKGLHYARAIVACDKIANMRASVRLMRDGIPLDSYLHGTWDMHIAVWSRLGTLFPDHVHPLLYAEFRMQLERVGSMSKRFQNSKGGG